MVNIRNRPPTYQTALPLNSTCLRQRKNRFSRRATHFRRPDKTLHKSGNRCNGFSCKRVSMCTSVALKLKGHFERTPLPKLVQKRGNYAILFWMRIGLLGAGSVRKFNQIKVNRRGRRHRSRVPAGGTDLIVGFVSVTFVYNFIES